MMQTTRKANRANSVNGGRIPICGQDFSVPAECLLRIRPIQIVGQELMHFAWQYCHALPLSGIALNLKTVVDRSIEAA